MAKFRIRYSRNEMESCFISDLNTLLEMVDYLRTEGFHATIEIHLPKLGWTSIETDDDDLGDADTAYLSQSG